jgi:hypothetical protein
MARRGMGVMYVRIINENMICGKKYLIKNVVGDSLMV